MSGNLGLQTSTKGETTSKATTKTGYDRLDINKLYKGKTTEPVAKTVTQKHGMQSLGKALPARRGASVVKPETTPSTNTNNTNNSSVPPQQQQQPPPPQQTLSTNLGQPIPTQLQQQQQQQQQQKWTNSSSQQQQHPPGPPPPLNAPNVPPPGGPPRHEKNWNGPDMGGNYQSQRFAQEFPSLAAGSAAADPPPRQNSSQPISGAHNSSKSHDNQYGPGPILRPQTEGSWTQGGGGGKGMQRQGPPQQNAPFRESGQERPNLGGPTPPPMSLGPGGPAPPPLGAYSMQYRGGMPPFMHPQNAGPPGPGYYPQGMPRYGMPVPPGAPPTREHSDSQRESNRGGRPPPPMRPTQQFAVKPIIRDEDMKRMDDIDQEGSWASVRDDVDYNKKINFSDEEMEEKSSRKISTEDDPRREKKGGVRILERQHSYSTSDRENRYEGREQSANKAENVENEEDWNKRRNLTQYNNDSKQGNNGIRRGRDSRDEDWRGGGRFEDDSRNKKPSAPSVASVRGGGDPRGPPDFAGNKQFSNLPPRLLRQQQHGPTQTFPSGGGNNSQRKTPSPVSTSSSNSNKDQREFSRDWDREKQQQPTTQYRILARNRGDSESSSNSIRDKRGSNDYDSKIDKESKKDRETESLHGKMDSLDIRSEKREETRPKTGFITSSWADQVLDDDYTKEFHEIKPELIKEERTVPKRVYIQQRKVENMTTPQKAASKPEPSPEPKQVISEPVAKQEKPSATVPITDKQRAWGEREEREKNKNDKMSDSQQQNELNDSGSGGEREIILSDKAKKLVHSKEHSEKQQSEKRIHQDEPHGRDFQKQMDNNKERSDYDRNRERYGSNQQQEHDRQDRGWGGYRQDRQRGRWSGSSSSNDYRHHENRTPERDNITPAGDSTERQSHEKGKVIEKEGSPSAVDIATGKNKDEGKKDYSKVDDKRNLRNISEDDLDRRGDSKSGRGGKERVGHGVYQPRGGWTRPDTRGGRPSRGGGRDYYDNKPQSRRNEYERDQHHRDGREDSDQQELAEKEVTKDDIKKDDFDEDKSRKERETGQGEPSKKVVKSPVTNKRNNTAHPRGGSRLQGYGPPSEKPFSSTNASSGGKDDEVTKDKSADSGKGNQPPPTSAPVPLMELGDISPPNIPAGRQRHHGSRGGRGAGMQPRNQEPYSYNARGGVSKRGGGVGRGDAKPLMSISSNDMEKVEESCGSESPDDESKKGSTKRKEGSGDRFRQNQNELRNAPPASKTSSGKTTHESSSHSNNQDSTNNNAKSNVGSTGRSGFGSSETESYASSTTAGNANDGHGPVGNLSDNSENDSQKSKGNLSKDKSNFNSNKNRTTADNKAQQQQQPVHNANKDPRRVKHPPYDPSHQRPSMPPRFQKNVGPGGSNTSGKDGNEQSGWEKTVNVSKQDSVSQQPSSQMHSNTETTTKDSIEIKGLPANLTLQSVNAGAMDGSGGPLKTMIFENRNFKSVTKPAGSGTAGKLGSDNTKDSIGSSSGLELPKDVNIGFGKGSGEDGQDIDFVSSFDDQATSQVCQPITSSSHSTSKPMPIGQNRSFTPHQPSPISPSANDLTEKIQSVKRVWENAQTMPSVAEQTSSGVHVTEDSSFHGGFGNSSFKPDTSRDFSSSLQQQSQSSYAPGSSPALISKPDSSTSPNSSNLRQAKSQQQTTMETQSHSGMTSSSPFTYSMPPPQQMQGNAFGGPPAVPSPPAAVMYGASQQMHTGVYQAFPHVDTSHNAQRSQYGQYSNPPQGGGGAYGLNTSIFMTSMDSGYQQQMSSYQQHSQQQQHQQHSQSGQAPNPNNRISPGPGMPSSAGGNAGLMMNSSNMKSQQASGGAHPNMSQQQQHQHQVMSHNQQQGFSQMGHHHPGGTQMGHHPLPVGPVGPAKPTGYGQGGMTSQSQIFIPYDPQQQQVINLGSNYMSSGMRNAPPQVTGPPPPATPPVQGLQGSSNYYSGNAGNQVYHPGSNQGGNLQQLHVAVAPNPQALQNLQTATQQFGLQFQQPLNLQAYNQQAASTVSALNLGGQLIRQPGPPTGHSHYNMKQPGMEMVQQSHAIKSHDTLLNQTWNPQFSLNQGFHGGNKTGGGVVNTDRNSGNNLGNQRKGNHPIGSMSNLGGGPGQMKYMQNPGGYPSSQQQQQQQSYTSSRRDDLQHPDPSRDQFQPQQQGGQ